MQNPGSDAGAFVCGERVLITHAGPPYHPPSFRGARSASPESITTTTGMAYYVYLLASRKHGTLYLGVTNDIVRRVHEHRTKAAPGFTSRYGVDKLVWFEVYDDATSAITREKELKKWRRDWKIRLIEEQNPGWEDLFPGISN
ncbi:putative endonuclease [Bradyrhizobium sp. USDA 3240]